MLFFYMNHDNISIEAKALAWLKKRGKITIHVYKKYIERLFEVFDGENMNFDLNKYSGFKILVQKLLIICIWNNSVSQLPSFIVTPLFLKFLWWQNYLCA